MTMMRIFTVFISLICLASTGYAGDPYDCLKKIDPRDGFLLSDPDGKILCQQNIDQKYVPASTLKLVTALAAIHHLGLDYRFKTEFYLDHENNLKIKGFGDPLLISEVWEKIAETLAPMVPGFNQLILDVSYFSQTKKIPGVGSSTNPYDAPTGALCANFNTVCFERDAKGNLISAEPQTPLVPFAEQRIRKLGLKKGRYTFTHHPEDAALYAAELFLCFMTKQGVKAGGDVHFGTVQPEDRLLFTHEAPFALDRVIRDMMEFSNNFVANQVLLSLGAHLKGPPADLDKGVRMINEYVKDIPGLEDLKIVEGSGISRENHISPYEMKIVLDHFSPYRHLLKKENQILYKTGTLKGIRTRVGYMETIPGRAYSFVIFLNQDLSKMDPILKCITAVSIPFQSSR